MINKEVMGIMLNAIPPYRGFEFQPVEYETHVGIRIFLDNFMKFSDREQKELGIWLGSEIINKIRQLGIPCYLEGVETRGGSKL